MFMSSKVRLTSLLAAFVMVAGMAITAQAQTVHPLTGNIRFQIGDGLPIPITFQPAPNGAIVNVPGAVVSQPSGADPRAITFMGGEFTYAPATAVLPVFLLNPAVYQVKTSLGVTYPLASTGFAAGGRIGAATVSFCPGSTVMSGTNPGCAGPGAGTTSLPGIMVYTKTAAQFGGAMTGRVFGGADVALTAMGTAVPPCAGAQCKVEMALASPNSTGTGGIGNNFGGGGTSPGSAVPSGAFTATITAKGAVVGVGAPSGPGVANPATSGGAPWTTGMLTVSQTAALAGAEIFVLTGSDARIGGVGTISLVAGGLSARATSGPNANRGWLNLTVGSALGALPSMSGPGIAALVGLMSLAGGYAMRQRNRK
jgi:hypothetical protein